MVNSFLCIQNTKSPYNKCKFKERRNPPHIVFSFHWVFPIVPLLFADLVLIPFLYPLLQLVPQVCIPGWQLLATSQPGMQMVRASVRSLSSILAPPPHTLTFTCKRAAAALILVPKSSFLRLAQTFSSSGLGQQAAACPSSQQPPLLLLSFARRGCPDTLSNVLAEFKD